MVPVASRDSEDFFGEKFCEKYFYNTLKVRQRCKGEIVSSGPKVFACLLCPAIFMILQKSLPPNANVCYPLFGNCVHFFSQCLPIALTFEKKLENPKMFV